MGVLNAVVLAISIPAAALAGSYLSTFLFESQRTLANYHLGVRVWLRTWIATVTHATRDAIDEDQTLLPVHFVWVLRRRGINGTLPIADPHHALTTAQRCAIEAALRVAPHVSLWVVGASLLGAKEHRDAWTSWQRGLARHNDRPLGQLVVRLHQFHNTTLVGSALRSHGVKGAMYSAHEWGSHGLPSHPAAVSDLVRLDVLEGEGGLYLDLDVIALHSHLLRLRDGVGLQAAPPWHPFSGGTAARPLHALLSNAVLVSRRPNGSLPREIARCAWRSLGALGAGAAADGSGAARLEVSDLLGSQAATEAWVESSAWRPPWRLYSETLFGFAACGRDHDGASRCVDYSSSDMPLDCETDATGWDAFLHGRLAQHSIKSLRFNWRARRFPEHGEGRPTCEQGQGTLRARIAQEACPAAWDLSARQTAAGRRVEAVEGRGRTQLSSK